MTRTIKVYFAVNEATLGKTLGNLRLETTNHVVRGVGNLKAPTPPRGPPTSPGRGGGLAIEFSCQGPMSSSVMPVS